MKKIFAWGIIVVLLGLATCVICTCLFELVLEVIHGNAGAIALAFGVASAAVIGGTILLLAWALDVINGRSNA